MSLTPLPAALAQLFNRLPAPPDTEIVPLEGLLGRVLAEPVAAISDVPAADNSAMDGYAVRSSDLPGVLPVSQRIPAGSAAQPLAAGSAARIFTGGVIPEGADAVVIQEHARAREGSVEIDSPIAPGANIRRQGADMGAGSVNLAVGKVLAPQHIGLIAASGHDAVSVYRRLRVAILCTGSELVEPGDSALAPWEVFNSNRFQLLAQVAALGMEVVAALTLPDDPELIGDALDRAAEQADCIITSGGVSVGEEDHVRAQIEARGRVDFWKLAIKPGKPLTFGFVGDTPVFGVPGNPVSAWATFALVVKPWLLRAQGADCPPVTVLRARAGFAVERPGSREEYLRVIVDPEQNPPIARPAGDQSSGVLSSVSRADGLAVIPVGETVSVDDWVDVLPIPALMSPHYGA